MATLGASGAARTHTVRLLVGTSEESSGDDVKACLAAHAPPDLSLVLDSDFPVVVGEKAWNALVDGLLPPSGTADLLAFAALAGRDLDGAGLGLPRSPPPWGGFETNVATVKPAPGGGLALTVNVRAPPALFGDALRAHLEEFTRAFDARTGAALVPSGSYGDAPLAFDPESKIVKRLRAAYARATGRPSAPVVSAGGTYAKRFPRAIPFGMWFPGSPYPGHAADERVSVAALHEGARVLLEALADLACGPRLDRPFEP